MATQHPPLDERTGTPVRSAQQILEADLARQDRRRKAVNGLKRTLGTLSDHALLTRLGGHTGRTEADLKSSYRHPFLSGKRIDRAKVMDAIVAFEVPL